MLGKKKKKNGNVFGVYAEGYCSIERTTKTDPEASTITIILTIPRRDVGK